MERKRLNWLSLPVLFAVLVVVLHGTAMIQPDGTPAASWQLTSRAKDPPLQIKKQTGDTKPGGAGAATEPKTAAKAESGAITIRPGDPIWITATIEIPTKEAITTIRPDCFNTVFTLRSKGRLLLPSCRLRTPYDIPDDVVTIQPKDKNMKQGQPFKVVCNLEGNATPMFPPESLVSGRTYTVQATYHNTIQDPDLIDGKCTVPDNNCYRLWTGKNRASLSITSIRVEGEPVTPVPARVSYEPDRWALGWSKDQSQLVNATITIPRTDCRQVDPKKVLLNGTVRPINDGERTDELGTCVVGLKFAGREALQSVGTPVPGSFYVTVQGELAGTYFTATHRITIQDSEPAP
jgi:hypothetical protein